MYLAPRVPLESLGRDSTRPSFLAALLLFFKERILLDILPTRVRPFAINDAIVLILRW